MLDLNTVAVVLKSGKSNDKASSLEGMALHWSWMHLNILSGIKKKEKPKLLTVYSCQIIRWTEDWRPWKTVYINCIYVYVYTYIQDI